MDQISKAFDDLSDEWQEAITDVDVDQKINDINAKYKLQLDTANTIYMETNYVILGLKDADGFRAELAKDPKIPLQILDSLVADINKEVLEAIRMKIIENQEFDEEFEEIEDSAPQREAPAVNVSTASVMPDTNTIPPAPVFASASNPISSIPQTDMTPVPTLQSHEDTILKESGIDMNESAPVTPVTQTVQANMMKDLVQSKLNGAFSMGKEASDHSLPAMGGGDKSGQINNAPQAPKTASDPYRETF